MLPQRFGQVWLYHGGTPLRELLQPHGFKERVSPLERIHQHHEAQDDDSKDRDQIHSTKPTCQADKVRYPIGAASESRGSSILVLR